MYVHLDVIQENLSFELKNILLVSVVFNPQNVMSQLFIRFYVSIQLLHYNVLAICIGNHTYLSAIEE